MIGLGQAMLCFEKLCWYCRRKWPPFILGRFPSLLARKHLKFKTRASSLKSPVLAPYLIKRTILSQPRVTVLLRTISKSGSVLNSPNTLKYQGRKAYLDLLTNKLVLNWPFLVEFSPVLLRNRVPIKRVLKFGTILLACYVLFTFLIIKLRHFYSI